MNRQRFSRRSWPSAEVPFRPPVNLPHASGAARPVRPLVRPLSRRQFLGTTAGAAGLAVSSGLLTPGAARAGGCDNVNPNPVPFSQMIAGYGPFHTYNPGPADQGLDPSGITDFNGFDGVAVFSGSATDGSGNTLGGHFGFMKGVYVGVDGKNHQGAFAFI